MTVQTFKRIWTFRRNLLPAFTGIILKINAQTVSEILVSTYDTTPCYNAENFNMNKLFLEVPDVLFVIYLSVYYLLTFLYIYVNIHFSIYLHIYQPTYLSVYSLIYLSFYSVHPSTHPYRWMDECTYIYIYIYIYINISIYSFLYIFV
jgi:hypothetical protein